MGAAVRHASVLKFVILLLKLKGFGFGNEGCCAASETGTINQQVKWME